MDSVMDMREALSAFSGKRVFVTGHTGFKGAWLTFLLNELGAEVMGFALPPEPGPSHFGLLGLHEKITHVEGDIRDASVLNDTMGSFRPEYVFHLAAQALVKKSYEDPISTFGTNVMGSVNLLDAVRNSDSVRSLVYVTSDKCYENVEWIWGYRENDRIGGRDPYSASKGAAELVFSSYARSFFEGRQDLGRASVRAGNVIGGGDWAADRVIPDCIRAIEKGVPITLRHPEATRPWQHVLEPISGYLLLAAQLRKHPDSYSGAWNFGPTSLKVRNVEQVATSMITHLGRGEIQIESSDRRHHEATLLQLNCDKAQQLLRWSPRWDIDKTLAATAEWYKVFLEGGDIESVTRHQLREYFQELQ